MGDNNRIASSLSLLTLMLIGGSPAGDLHATGAHAVHLAGATSLRSTTLSIEAIGKPSANALADDHQHNNFDIIIIGHGHDNVDHVSTGPQVASLSMGGKFSV